MKIEPPNPFGQSHAIHCSEPLNPRREPLQLIEMTLFFIVSVKFEGGTKYS